MKRGKFPYCAPIGAYASSSWCVVFGPLLPQKQMQAPIRDKELVALKNKRAMDTALSPLKSIGMNAFMLYMGGKSIRIFSIMMVAMAFVNPIKAIMGTTQVFSKLDQEDQVRLDITVGLYHLHKKRPPSKFLPPPPTSNPPIG